jgi:Predicted nucleotide-binding protein containing TIR-like domain
MSVNRRVLISAPRDIRLDDERKRIKQAIIDHIQSHYQLEMFRSDLPGDNLVAGLGWSVHAVEKVARRCVGAALIGLPFWHTELDGKEIWLPTDYCPYEGGVAHSLGLPILAISVGIEQRGIFHDHAPVHAVSIRPGADLSWLDTAQFRVPFERWKKDIDQRPDVFFGYCSESKATADEILRLLEDKLCVSVRNWAANFGAGRTILTEIEEAKAMASCGVFLFSEDDHFKGRSGQGAPRDNVVFEAGYFMGSKGAERCLIIRHGDAKLPTDLGGYICVPLAKNAPVKSIEGQLTDFVSRNLG